MSIYLYHLHFLSSMPYDFQRTDSWLKCPQHKVIYRLSAILVKIPMAFYTELQQIILKFEWNNKRSLIAKAILKKKNNLKVLSSPDFKLCCKTIVVKTVWYWHKNRDIAQCKWIKNPEINPCLCGWLTYDKTKKYYTRGKDCLFNK